MGLFGNPRKNKDKWAKIVVANVQPGMVYDDDFLEAATAMFIMQHTRILYDCIRLVCTTKNRKTKKGRYELACKKYILLARVRKYANKVQKADIDSAIDDFIKMQDYYHHPNKYEEPVFNNSKQMKDDFWEVYAQGEMLDIFSGKKK